jgi:predicted anti-sigma-YlaC factor YlaD
MKIKCDVINDLLPLYVDDVLSDASRELVNEHIKECESCRKTLENMTGKVSIPVSPELRKEDTKPIKGLKKIVTKWKWLTAVITVLAVLAILFLGFQYINAKQIDIPYD